MARNPLLPGGRPLRLVEHALDSLVFLVLGIVIGLSVQYCLASFFVFSELVYMRAVWWFFAGECLVEALASPLVTVVGFLY